MRIVDGRIATSVILDGAITTAKILDANVTSPKLAISTVQYATVEISSAEILLLNTTPKTLVAALGAGKLPEFISLELAFDYNTVAYTVVGCTNLQVKYTNGAGVAVSTLRAAAGFLEAVSDTLSLLDKLEATVVPAVNAALVLDLAGANPAAGNSVIHAKVAYRDHATGL